MDKPTIKTNFRSEQSGFVLLLAMIIGMTLLVTLTGIMSLSLYNLTSAKRSLSDISSLYVAEAGADKAIFQVNQDNTYTGTNTVCPIGSTGSNPVTLFNDSVKGRGTYESCIAAGTIANEKIVYSIGKIYIPAASTTPYAVSRVKAIIEGSQTGSYGVVTGPGGLIMTNSATVVNGPLFIGGYLTMSNYATIASPTAPVGVTVANNRCPSPATSAYPQICPSGTLPNPITITDSAHIYGNVVANGQSNGAGMSLPGLTASSGAAASALPDYNRTGQINAVTAQKSASDASCSGSGSVTWPANVHITGGDVSISNNCTVTVLGNAWIDGGFTASNKAVIVAGSTLTATPTIMVDGSKGVTLNNQSQVSANSAAIGLSFITFYSTATCNPNCSTVTGTDLYNSQSVTTITLGNQGLAAGSSFYARWTKLILSNAGSLGQIMAQTIQLNNSGSVSFGTSSSGGTYAYDVRYYERY